MRHRFLFWNINKRQLQARVGGMASAREVDVIALAGIEMDPPSLELEVASCCQQRRPRMSEFFAAEG